MKFSEFRQRAKDRVIGEFKSLRQVEIFSDDMSLVGEEEITEFKLLFHGFLSVCELKKEAEEWDLRHAVAHLGDCMAPLAGSKMGYMEGPSKENQVPIEIEGCSLDSVYLDKTGRYNNREGVLLIKTTERVVVLYHSSNLNETDQYPNAVRDLDNCRNIRRTGGYTVYSLPLTLWAEISSDDVSFQEFSETLTAVDSCVIGHWKGFGNIA